MISESRPRNLKEAEYNFDNLSKAPYSKDSYKLYQLAQQWVWHYEWLEEHRLDEAHLGRIDDSIRS